MAYVARSQEPSRRRRLSVDSLSLLELVVLVPVAGVLVLWLVPSGSTSSGAASRASESRATRPATATRTRLPSSGTFGWIVVAIVVLFAHIAERPRLGAVIAAAWFGLLVGGALLWAAAIGPAQCPR